MAELNYEQDLAINKNRLDEELLDQAQKMFRYSQAHAQAQLNRDRAKQALDVVKANLDSSIRFEASEAERKAANDEAHWATEEAKAKELKNKEATATAQGMRESAKLARSNAKITEPQVTAKILSHPNYQEALAKYQEAEYQVNLIFGAVLAMNARRSMLENFLKGILGQLWAMPQMAEPRGPGMAEAMAGAAVNASEAAILKPLPPGTFPAISNQTPAPASLGEQMGHLAADVILENKAKPTMPGPPVIMPPPPPARPTPRTEK